MAHRIEVGLLPGATDSRGDRIQEQLNLHLDFEIEAVRTIDVYTIDTALSQDELTKAAEGPFVDPIMQEYRIDQPLASDFDVLIEVGFRPGVTDNVGRTAKEAIQFLLGKKLGAGEGVYTSVQYLLKGDVDVEKAQTIAGDFLSNELIQRVSIFTAEDYSANWQSLCEPPRVVSSAEPVVVNRSLDIADEELVALSRDGMLALTLNEMQCIRDHFRKPEILAAREKIGLSAEVTDVELEALAQTWSEHCKHKIFAAKIDYIDEQGNSETIDSLFKSYIMQATADIRAQKGAGDFCLSVFKDNAGVISFNDDWSMVFKVETHNSPSALDPYGGALTGIVGVNRDGFGTGLGARLIFNTDVFCFASPFHEGELPPRLLHPRRIFEGVVEGVEHGGNKSGVPTVNGSIYFDERFLGKPLVYCGTASLMPKESAGRPCHEKKALPGDRIVMVGGRIGKDGIHGATFSSEELHEGSPATAVQIGDPITQKRMWDFLMITRDRAMYTAITDNGAGGLSSSVGEMAEFTGGFEMHLDKAPLKYPGLQPWEILISEAQERMTVSVPPEMVDEFIQLAEEMDVEATDLGQFTDSGYFHCLYDGKTVCYLDMDFIHDGVPQLELPAKWTPPELSEPEFAEEDDYTADLAQLLGSLNICSKESVVRRYDHEVQGASIVKPLTGVENDGPSDAAVVRPVFDTFEGIVTAHGLCPRYSDIDTYHMMASAIDEGLRNYVATGGNIEHVAGLDNFCWCDPVESEKTPDGAYKAAQLVRANKALYDYCVAFGVPLISGKDSMKNDYQFGGTKISIPPTVLFSVIGKIDDVRKAVTMDVKKPGDLVYLLGVTKNELGASEYYHVKGELGANVPTVDSDSAFERYKRVNKAQASELIRSCHDLSDGGLAVALAEKAFAGGFGIEADLTKVTTDGNLTNQQILFSESQSRLLMTVTPENDAAFKAIFGDDAACIGTVTEDSALKVTGVNGGAVIAADIDQLKDAWQATLKEL